MKSLVAGVLFLIAFMPVAQADGPPQYMKDSLPEHALMDVLKGYGVLKGEGASIDAKTREMIALGVAAQIPCEYCVYSHTERLRKLGASANEIKEAVAISGYIRLFSTLLNGNPDLDWDKFTAEFDKALAAN